MKTGLFFGTFNPIHIGHLIIANYMVEKTDLDQVWFVVSPQNPHKTKESLLDEKLRLYMVNIALEDNDYLFSSNIEFDLPTPSYTVDTLTHLKEKNPKREFVLIMGQDNLVSLPRWRNHEYIIHNHNIYVYKREGYELDENETFSRVKIFDVPLLNISASFIRNSIKNGLSARYMVPEKALQYINEMNLYK